MRPGEPLVLFGRIDKSRKLELAAALTEQGFLDENATSYSHVRLTKSEVVSFLLAQSEA